MNGTNNYINLTWNAAGSQGGFFSNDTNNSATVPTNTGIFDSAHAFTVDSFKMVADKLWPNSNNASIYLRYWLDPWPDTVASGIYNTTYVVRAVEWNTTSGSGVC